MSLTDSSSSATPCVGTAVVDGAPHVVVGRHGASHVQVLHRTAPRLPDNLLALIAGWDDWGADVLALAAATGDVPVEGLRWLPPVMPNKLVCIGANYGRHNAEMVGDADQEVPYSFLKPPTTSLVGHGHDVTLPPHATKIDYEAELAVVIGRRCFGVAAEDAASVIFGYAILNDLSARDWVPAQSWMGFDWTMLKGWDESAPMGPWITPAAHVPDPQALGIRLWVNDEIRQDSTTADMVFDVARIVEHLSSVMTLEPGDVIATGTPDGVAFGRDPSPWLTDGDTVRIEIDGLGSLSHALRAAAPAPDHAEHQELPTA